MNKVQLAVLQVCVVLKEEANVSGVLYHVAKQLHTIPTIGAINIALNYLERNDLIEKQDGGYFVSTQLGEKAKPNLG
jgi:hypothetical protein